MSRKAGKVALSAGPQNAAGPSVKHANVNVNVFDFKFTDGSAPSFVEEGDTVRFTATVGEYKPTRGCLFFLTPVSTTAR